MKSILIMFISKNLIDLCTEKQNAMTKKNCMNCLQCYSSKEIVTNHWEVCLKLMVKGLIKCLKKVVMYNLLGLINN